MGDIVPKCNATGIDICAVEKYHYVIRSDLGCYMRSTNFEKGDDLVVLTLHPSCMGGISYMAHENEFFYVIYGNSYRRVTNLNEGSGGILYTLHPNCRGGDHYISSRGYCYIIFQKRGIYRKTLNMQTDYQGKEFPLHVDCKDGLYYWGTQKYFYLINKKGINGLKYQRTCRLNQSNTIFVEFTLHPDVINFLPGGLGITKGIASGKWQYVKSFVNDSDRTITWIRNVNRNVDIDKFKMSSIEDKWRVKANYKNGGLTTAIIKHQLSLPRRHGGIGVNIKDENWNNKIDHEESVCLIMKPGEIGYLWQCVLSLGAEDVLIGRNMRIEYGGKDIPPPYANTEEMLVPMSNTSKK